MSILRALAVASVLLSVVAPLPASAQPVPALSDTLLDFGDIPFPNFATRDFTIYNQGDQQLIIADVYADIWWKFTDDAVPGAIEAGDSQVVNVTYAPGTVTFDSTGVNVVFFAGTLDTLRLGARGRGVPNVPRIDVSVDTISAIVPGRLSVVRPVTITNLQGGELQWSASENPVTGFVTLSRRDGSLEWLESDIMNVSMTASSQLPPGEYSTTIEISSNDVNNNLVTVVVIMKVQESPYIRITPNPIDFGTIFLGYTTRKTIEIANIGVGTLIVSGVFGNNPIVTVDPTNFFVPQGQSVEIDAIVTPTQGGPFSGTLTFNSNDLDTPQKAVAFSGVTEANPPIFALNPDTLEVTMPWPDATVRRVYLANGGGGTLQWSVAESAPWLQIAPNSGSLPALSVDSTAFNFSSGYNVGEYTAGAVFTTNDPANPIRHVFTRMIVPAVYRVESPDTSFDFGVRPAGTQVQRVLAVQNVGNSTLQFLSVTTSDPVVFQTDPPPNPITPQNFAYIPVRFIPSEEGIFDGELRVVNNSTNNDTIVVPLHGEGLPTLDLKAEPDSILATMGAAGWEVVDVSVSNPGVRNQQVDLFAMPGTSTPAFYENFEDFDYVGWIVDSGGNTKGIIDAGANSAFAFHEESSFGGHGNGIHRNLEDPVQVREVSFWVRPGQDDKYSNYVTLHDGVGRDAIYFFALDDGRFYCNDNTGGDHDYPYEPDTWYRIEYRDFDWSAKTFDYYVNGELIKADVGIRSPQLVNDIYRVRLYSYSVGAEATWDNIWLSWSDDTPWLSVSPSHFSLDSLETTYLQVRLNGAEAGPGTHYGFVAMRCNNPVVPLQAIPVQLVVDPLTTDADGGAPMVTALHQNVPNPFNPATVIGYDLRDAAAVSIVIYDVTGARVRELVSGRQPAGRYTATWDGTDDRGRGVASGVYFYRLRAAAFTQTRKMLLLK